MPIQGKDSFDDKKLKRIKSLNIGGPDPEKEDNVMLVRNRVSRIYYLKKFFDYPISLKFQTFYNMGLVRTVQSGVSYLKSLIIKKDENSLEDFYINTGKVDSLEVLNADDPNHIIPIVLYDPNNIKLSLLHLALEKAYGWKIGHVDASIQKLSRQFEVERESVYDFLMNEVCEKFNCYIVFDTINNTINIYAESLTSKFIGDGSTNTFTISPPFAQVGAVSVDGYKTTRWEYNSTTGALVLEDIPESGAHIEVVDGALTEWETDVFITFNNLAQEIKID
jgi:hypothetical protein